MVGIDGSDSSDEALEWAVGEAALARRPLTLVHALNLHPRGVRRAHRHHSVCVGALDLFRSRPGPLDGVALAGALVAAQLAGAPLLDIMTAAQGLDDHKDTPAEQVEEPDPPPVEADRVEVYQATGMLISALRVDADEALVRLRAHAMATGQTASHVARAIIERRLMLDRDDPGSTGAAGRSRG